MVLSQQEARERLLAEAYGEQCADTDGLALEEQSERRIAALEAKLEATMADMRSLQRQNENWRAECSRLCVLLVEAQTQLAQRMALPANALKHSR